MLRKYKLSYFLDHLTSVHILLSIYLYNNFFSARKKFPNFLTFVTLFQIKLEHNIANIHIKQYSFTHSSIYKSFYLSNYLSLFLSNYLYFYLSFYLSNYLSQFKENLNIIQLIYTSSSTLLPIHLSIILSIYLSI